MIAKNQPGQRVFHDDQSLKEHADLSVCEKSNRDLFSLDTAC